MQKILMILTHNRLDCLMICLEMLAKAQALQAFDKVVFLLNGVSSHHQQAVDGFIAQHPDVSWDQIHGPGTRPQGISWMQNECIKRYPEALYVKVDEDVFVPSGWAERLFAAYEHYKDRDDLALITPLIPNNSYGLSRLLNVYYPGHLEEHRKKFNCDPSPEVHGLTWNSPYVGEWASRLFVDLDAANERHREILKEQQAPSYHEFCKYFSIGCICYDYRHIERMGGVPETDEPGWSTWIENNKQLNIQDDTQIVLHYSFFVQQDWLDRSSLLEDIRRENLPDTLPRKSFTKYHLPRYVRMARQAPRVTKRRLGIGD